MEASAANDLLQLVDMVCGAVARSLRVQRPDEQFRRVVRHREYEVRFWPEQGWSAS